MSTLTSEPSGAEAVIAGPVGVQTPAEASDATSDGAIALAVRLAVQADVALVFNSWLKSYRHSQFAKPMRDDDFYASHHRAVEDLIARPSARVYVCTPEGDQETVLGWMACEQTTHGPVVHYAYTKPAFRQMGVLRSMLAAAGLDLNSCIYTHSTIDAVKIRYTHPDSRYVPHLFWR